MKPVLKQKQVRTTKRHLLMSLQVVDMDVQTVDHDMSYR